VPVVAAEDASSMFIFCSLVGLLRSFLCGRGHAGEADGAASKIGGVTCGKAAFSFGVRAPSTASVLARAGLPFRHQAATPAIEA